MSGSWFIWVLVIVSTTCGLIYLFVIADPKTSAAARLVTMTLPHEVYRLCERHCSARTLERLTYMSDRVLLIAYCSIVYGCWGVVFVRVFPWIDEQTYLPQYHKYGGCVVFLLCVLSWRLAAGTSPGIVTIATATLYDHFPYDGLLFVEGQKCRTTSAPRLARSKFDQYRYHANVPRYDHYCGWVHNAIGEENYRWFLLFLAVHALMLLYGTFALSTLFQGEIAKLDLWNAVFVDRNTGVEFKATRFIVFQYLFNARTAEAGLLLITSVMFVVLTGFLLYHIWLTTRNVTTNEAGKWDQVHKWYNAELKRYNKHKTSHTHCKTDNGNQHHNDNEKEEVEHPGPRPINIYDRGFIENWKEVLFPISLRRRRQRAVLQKQQQQPLLSNDNLNGSACTATNSKSKGS